MRAIPFHPLERLESRFLMAAGDLDAAFSGGKVLHDLLGGDEVAFAMAVQSDGKLLLAGRADGDFALVRLNSNGSLDSTFGASGIVTTDMGTASDAAPFSGTHCCAPAGLFVSSHSHSNRFSKKLLSHLAGLVVQAPSSPLVKASAPTPLL